MGLCLGAYAFMGMCKHRSAERHSRVPQAEDKDKCAAWDSRAGNRQSLNHARRIKCISCDGEREPDAGMSYTLINACNHF